ncbi:MAG: DsbA family oxidoreductase [Rubrivivax sp.]|jgi:predicted DsbA family dithiol-disulfide isomerase|nr:DsbA family oxidoreductase [Rubrivivax sp.]
MRIDFISDVACPWCAVGLNSLEQALARLGPDIPVELHFQPFELNPQLEADGVDTLEYLSRKYGLSAAQVAQNQQTLRERGAAVGFAFGIRGRVWNTFDAHRLLAWAGGMGGDAQRRLKHALLKAYHGEGRNPGSREVLLALVTELGLDSTAAAAVLDSDAHADEVREAEALWQRSGIQSVPSVVINRQHLIQGGQPPEVFEQALRQLASS